MTRETILAAIERARVAACGPHDHRCLALPWSVEQSLATLTPEGRCRIGWIVWDSGRQDRDVWLDLRTGEGRLRQPRPANR